MQIIEAKCPAANEICSLIVGWVSSSTDTIAAPFIIHFIQKMIQNGFCFRFKEKPNEIPQQKTNMRNQYVHTNMQLFGDMKKKVHKTNKKNQLQNYLQMKPNGNKRGRNKNN